MLQVKDFKFIKDKKLRTLYQVIWHHLTYLDNLNQPSDVHTYHNFFKAYKNGYTSNHKMFKELLKSHTQYPDIYLDWINVFIESKLTYLNNPIIKRLDDLYNFSELQSKFGFLLLITDKLGKHHLQFINIISKIDKIAYLLYEDKRLNHLNTLYFPTQLIDDFGIERTLQGSFLQNEKYIALWEYLHFKVQGFIKDIKTICIQFNDIEQALMNMFIDHIQSRLKIRKDELILHIKTLS